jgi:hypothetical protein
MSKPRKSIKPTNRDFHATGTEIRVMSWPATSSMTTNPGSLSPAARATRVAAGIPIHIVTPASKAAAIACQLGGIQRVSPHQISTVASDAHVPGPGRSHPIPKNVATNVAQRGAFIYRHRPWRHSLLNQSSWEHFGGASGIESDTSRTGDEITYSPLAHLPRSISRHRSLQKGKSAFSRCTGFLHVGQGSFETRLRAMVLRRFSRPGRNRELPKSHNDKTRQTGL